MYYKRIAHLVEPARPLWARLTYVPDMGDLNTTMRAQVLQWYVALAFVITLVLVPANQILHETYLVPVALISLGVNFLVWRLNRRGQFQIAGTLIVLLTSGTAIALHLPAVITAPGSNVPLLFTVPSLLAVLCLPLRIRVLVVSGFFCAVQVELMIGGTTLFHSVQFMSFLLFGTALVVGIPLALIWKLGQALFLEQQATARLNALTLSLLDQVADRTADLTASNTALDAANHDLREVNVQLESLLAIRQIQTAEIAHDQRTELTGLNAMLAEAVGQLEDAGADQALLTGFSAHAGANIDAVDRLIGVLVTAAQLESDALHLQPTVVSVGDLLSTLATRMAPVCRRAGIALIAAPMPAAAIWADQMHLERVMLNLIDNARKYHVIPDTPGAEPPFIRLHALLAPTTVVLVVEDDGPGIADVAAVMSRWVRGATTKVSGSGLGLSLCAALVDRMGGTMSIDSTLGRGTTVKVTLPRADLAERVRSDTPPEPRYEVTAEAH